MRKHLSLFALALVALLCATACNKDEEKKLAPEMDSSQIGAYEPFPNTYFNFPVATWSIH